MKRVGVVSALGALVGLTASSCVGAVPPAAVPPAAVPPAAVPPAAPAPSTQIVVAAKPEAQVSAAPPSREALACLAPMDPEFERESPWSRAVGTTCR